MTVLTFWRRGRQEQPAPAGAPDRPAPREAVVLSGGGSLGAAQVGALQALFEAGIVPDVVVGCSVGALNAAYLACEPTLNRAVDLEHIWRELTPELIFPDSRFTVARRYAAKRDHLYSPAGLRGLIERSVQVADLADTAIPVHVVTTDLRAGEPVWWTGGDPVEVLSASACLPLLFPPVALGGSLHVDGGVSCPVPTQRALDLGATRVWVLDVAREFHGWADARMTAMDVLLESFAITRSHLGRLEAAPRPGQRVVNLPALRMGRHDIRDFTKTSALITAGREAGRAMIAAERSAAPATAVS